MVRVRQILHRLGQSLLLVPLLFVVAAIALSRVMAVVDGRLGDERVPNVLATTVEGGRAMLTAIAGGLISSVTLLLSLVLVAVQLASSQYSPRTLQGWTGDRTQQVTIGLVLGTSVYCLLVLRETRALGEGEELIPHLSVLLAVALGVLSLIAVVRSVDHLTNSLRVGSVAGSITEQTVALVHQRGRDLALEQPKLRPGGQGSGLDVDQEAEIPADALPVTAGTTGGWVQQIDEAEVLAAIASGTTVHMAVGVGTHVLPSAPLAFVSPRPATDDCAAQIRAAIALGAERTMQEDIGYGILQLVDIAVRAMSPGINDPNTANDVIVNLGVVLLALWEYPEDSPIRTEDGRSMVRRQLGHGDLLHASFGPLRRYAAADPSVVETMVRMLATLRSEVERRELPGPIGPIDDTLAAIVAAFEDHDPARIDRVAIQQLMAKI